MLDGVKLRSFNGKHSYSAQRRSVSLPVPDSGGGATTLAWRRCRNKSAVVVWSPTCRLRRFQRARKNAAIFASFNSLSGTRCCWSQRPNFAISRTLSQPVTLQYPCCETSAAKPSKCGPIGPACNARFPILIVEDHRNDALLIQNSEPSNCDGK